jgi:hypothetical protein
MDTDPNYIRGLLPSIQRLIYHSLLGLILPSKLACDPGSR